MIQPLRVLIVDDRPAGAASMIGQLRRVGLDPNWVRVDTEADYRAHLGTAPDLILCEYRLRKFNARSALAILEASGSNIPFIVVSSTRDEALLLECLGRGATDYLLKHRLPRLGPAARRALKEKARREELRVAIDAIAELEEQYRLLIDHANDLIFLVDLEGRLLFSSHKGAELTGYSREELTGQSLLQLVTPEGRNLILARLHALQAGQGVPPCLETQLVTKAGIRVWVEANFAGLVKDGRRVARLGVVRDISERKRVEEAVRQREKVAAMGSLLAGVAHELNNPLSVVLCQAGLLREMTGGGPLADRAEKIVLAADRAARIVQNFLALARQQPPQYQSVRLSVVVQEALELLAYPLRIDNVEVKLHLPPDLPALCADPHQLHQVVINLVANAHQAMRQGQSPRRLTLITGFDPVRQTVSLRVADTGPGIPPEILPRVFEPFFTTKPPGQGTGLGLSLCDRIIEGHGGTIRAESPPGSGAIFTIELPIAAPHAEPAAQVREVGPPITGKRILVVDDEREVASVLSDALALDGHDVDTVTSGTQALAFLHERTYDLIISDIRMPGLTGPNLYREITTHYPELRDHVIFLTGDALGLETAEFLAEAGTPSLTKPFVLEEVRQVVRRALGLSLN